MSAWKIPAFVMKILKQETNGPPSKTKQTNKAEGVIF